MKLSIEMKDIFEWGRLQYIAYWKLENNGVDFPFEDKPTDEWPGEHRAKLCEFTNVWFAGFKVGAQYMFDQGQCSNCFDYEEDGGDDE